MGMLLRIQTPRCLRNTRRSPFFGMTAASVHDLHFPKDASPDLSLKNATDYHTDAKCCHAGTMRLDYAGLRFSLHHGCSEQTLRVRRITPLPTTCCHKLPPNCKLIVPCEQRIYFAGRKKNKYNEYGSSNNFKKKV